MCIKIRLSTATLTFVARTLLPSLSFMNVYNFCSFVSLINNKHLSAPINVAALLVISVKQSSDSSNPDVKLGDKAWSNLSIFNDVRLGEVIFRLVKNDCLLLTITPL